MLFYSLFVRCFMKNKYLRLKIACYSSNVSMSVTGNISPLLFLIFRARYGISFSLLGLLVLINFSTQLLIDLVFSFFSHKFNVKKTVKLMPFLCFAGLWVYALSPLLFPNRIYFGICLGTVIFSASSGLGEVLISPVVASVPSDNAEREMSILHSVYAWGVVGVVIFSTTFLYIFGSESWQILVFILSFVPLCSAFLFFGAEIPEMQSFEKASGVLSFLKNKGVWICVAAIFLGGAAECTMAQWASGYLEGVLGIPKVWGDVFGVALFGAALGMGRSLYGKFGKNITRVLILGSAFATVCYLLAAFSPFPFLGLISCAFTGFCVSMLWPGNLVVAAERFPAGGVTIYALMASGGDLGASVGPQLVGIITDFAIENEKIVEFTASISASAESIGMKAGMVIGSLFPLLSVFLYLFTRKKEVEFT